MKRHLPLACSILALAACSSISDTEQQKRIDVYTETAQGYFQVGDLNRAEAQALKGLEIDPENQRLRLIHAWTLQRRGRTADIAEAEKIFLSLEDSGDFLAMKGLGEALERKGQVLQESADDLKSGKHITEAADPAARIADYEARSHAAWVDARSKYEKTLVLLKDDKDALNGLMRIEALLGNPEKSLEWADKLVLVSQVDLEFWEAKSVRTDMSAEEESHLRGLVRGQKKLQVATHLHASSLEFNLGRPEKALVHLDRAYEIEPDRLDLLSRRAQVLKKLGRFKDASADLELFISRTRLDSNHPDIQRAWLLKQDCDRLARDQQARAR